MALSENPRVVVLIVPRTLVKAAKTAVSEAGWWGRGRISPLTGVGGDDGDPAFTLPTTLPHADTADTGTAAAAALSTLGLTAHAGAIRVISADAAPARTAPNALTTAITAFLHAHAAPSAIPSLLASAPRRWSFYPPLALLPANSFAAAPWPTFLSALSPALLAHFHRTLTHALSATHLAINAPIPSTSTLRLPHLTPLHGEFTALWSTTTQNRIHQTWAPLHTMFSRGNITEKARVLTFPDVLGANIADLYAGIGYFAFSYVAAGAARVWCWELNPWSVEALRRGAGMNGWGVMVVGAGEPVGEVADGVKLVVFCEDSRAAGERLRGRVKVKHVNLGLLPTSRGGWGTALEVVADGGWVHVHENVGEEEVGGCAGVVEEAFRVLEGKGEGEGEREVVAVGVERVKTFAPGVVHCVVDVRVGG